MLRLLTTETTARIPLNRGRPTIGVCLVLASEHPDHVAGNFPSIIWGSDGPRYTLAAGGVVEYRGRFIDDDAIRGALEEAALRRKHLESLPLLGDIYGKSLLVSRFRPLVDKALGLQVGWPRQPQDTQLMLAVIAESKRAFENEFQGRFFVLLWGHPSDQDYGTVLAGLRDGGIPAVAAEIRSEFHWFVRKYYKFALISGSQAGGSPHVSMEQFSLILQR